MKECKHLARTSISFVNFAKCQAKGVCVEVCPYDVFELQAIKNKDYAILTIKANSKHMYTKKIKSILSAGNNQE